MVRLKRPRQIRSNNHDSGNKGAGWRAGCTISFGVAVVGVVGAVLAAGPDAVVDRTKAAFGIYPPPQILRVERREAKPNIAYVVTFTNPSHEEVALLGYHVEPVPSFAGAVASTNEGGSEASRVVAEDVPARCVPGKRNVSLARTVVIQPKRTMELEIHPWTLDESCSFELRFRTSHGDSTTIAVWGFDREALQELLDQSLETTPRPPLPETSED